MHFIYKILIWRRGLMHFAASSLVINTQKGLFEAIATKIYARELHPLLFKTKSL